MAVNLNLVTINGGTVTPKMDGILHDASIGYCGIFHGCTVTINGNTVYVSSGYGLIKGRFFEIEDSSIAVTLSSSGTLKGRVYLRLDLSNTASPLQMLIHRGTSSTLPSLTQQDNANFTNGVWEMELATFDIGATALSNLKVTYDNLSVTASGRFSLTSVQSGTYTSGNIWLDKLTKTGFIWFIGRYSSDVPNLTTLFNVPQECVPTSDRYVPVIIKTGSDSLFTTLPIRADGTIKSGGTNYMREIIGFGVYSLL